MKGLADNVMSRGRRARTAMKRGREVRWRVEGFQAGMTCNKPAIGEVAFEFRAVPLNADQSEGFYKLPCCFDCSEE